MVALFETRESTATYVGEVVAAASPLTLVICDARQLAEPQALLSTLKVFSTGSTPDGEPTWEDAAWQ
ncbi:MAG: hypothetical protein IT336_05090 [Thermomicrobiales bacterium]|nr:hypothetical protein [Thermomicrobiales bacterium]